jgi:hypothetical protein
MISEPTDLRKGSFLFTTVGLLSFVTNYRWDEKCRILKVTALTPWSRVHVKNQIVAHLAKTFSAFYEARNFATIFVRILIRFVFGTDRIHIHIF